MSPRVSPSSPKYTQLSQSLKKSSMSFKSLQVAPCFPKYPKVPLSLQKSPEVPPGPLIIPKKIHLAPQDFLVPLSPTKFPLGPQGSPQFPPPVALCLSKPPKVCHGPSMLPKTLQVSPCILKFPKASLSLSTSLKCPSGNPSILKFPKVSQSFPIFLQFP